MPIDHLLHYARDSKLHESSQASRLAPRTTVTPRNASLVSSSLCKGTQRSPQVSQQSAHNSLKSSKNIEWPLRSSVAGSSVDSGVSVVEECVLIDFMTTDSCPDETSYPSSHRRSPSLHQTLFHQFDALIPVPADSAAVSILFRDLDDRVVVWHGPALLPPRVLWDSLPSSWLHILRSTNHIVGISGLRSGLEKRPRKCLIAHHDPSQRIMNRRPTPLHLSGVASVESHWLRRVIGFLALQTSDSLGKPETRTLARSLLSSNLTLAMFCRRLCSFCFSFV